LLGLRSKLFCYEVHRKTLTNYLNLDNTLYYSKLKKIHLLRILVKERALLRLVKIIGNGEYNTRELLQRIGAYGYGHRLLMKAEKEGLVKRSIVKNKIYNKLTSDGKRIIKVAREIGV
jgi:hypothetical protein